jgi:hypothetical protein
MFPSRLRSPGNLKRKTQLESPLEYSALQREEKHVPKSFQQKNDLGSPHLPQTLAGQRNKIVSH